MSSQLEKAEELRRLHEAPEPLVLVNAWDAVSARVVAAAPGARAIATASWSIAAARGFPDGEKISRGEMIEGVRIVADAVQLPVTADLERGFGDARLTLESAIEAGAVGCNLEDSDGSGGLWPAEEHAAVVAAARAAGDAAGIPIVINARTDVFLTDVVPAEERVVAALERGAAYLEAGADCIFVPFVRDLATIETLAKEMGGPRRRRARELRPGPAGRGDGRAVARCRDPARGRRPARGPRVPPVGDRGAPPPSG
jgi:2-methylisocitrate lyase-like PEP mutase family enzyme